MEVINRQNKKTKLGVVVSDKMKSSIVVKVEILSKHPLYGRTIKSFQKYMVHDEGNKSKMGDVVRIVECKPISKHKKWRLLEIVNQVS